MPNRISQIAVVVRDLDARSGHTSSWWAGIDREFLDKHGEGVQHIAVMKHAREEFGEFKRNFVGPGASTLMGGRTGETIEFCHLDTIPTLTFVLESGNGHARDLTPSRRYS